MQIIRAIARFVVAVLVVAYTLLDELLFPLFRPAIRWLSSLQLFQRLGALIGQLPPYLALMLLAVPFVIIEPAKVGALWVIATGHVVEGMVLLLIAQVLSLLICERIFHAAYGPLMRIGWFKAVLGWVFALRDRALAIGRSTAVWRAAVALGRGVRDWVRGLVGSLR
ncbi:MAG: hypothetical protein EON57_18840 [Alphaproteobacteria bacterium]|nr:MAG: hypothetical protein EON57_18840 [Alphaproteobacteria bacterium]